MASPTPPPKKPTFDDPYVFGDSIPAPDAQERNTDTAWALFHELTESPDVKAAPAPAPAPVSAPVPLPPGIAPVDAAYAPTAPAGLGQVPSAPADSSGLDALMQEARRNNRVCPKLQAWQQLYDLLPGKQQVNGQWQPPLPISPQAWRVTSSMVKRLCLRDHLEWADRHGAAKLMLVFLQSIPEDQWLHME